MSRATPEIISHQNTLEHILHTAALGNARPLEATSVHLNPIARVEVTTEALVKYAQNPDGSTVVFGQRYDNIPGRSRACTIVSEHLRLGIAPVVVVRQAIHDGVPWWCQVVEKFPDATENLSQAPEIQRALAWIFQYITYNRDRRQGNLLWRQGKKKLMATDNDFTFAAAQSDITFYSESRNPPYGVHIPREVIELFKNAARPENLDHLRQSLSQDRLIPGYRLLPDDEIEACIERIKYIAALLSEHGCIPKLDSGYNYLADPEFYNPVDQPTNLRKLNRKFKTKGRWAA